MTDVLLDPSAVDNALVVKLGTDPQLLVLCPDGVFIDTAPLGAVAYITVTVLDARNEYVFGGHRAWEDRLYLVEAVDQISEDAPSKAKQAAARIDEILENGSLTLPSGFHLMAMFRETALRYTVYDDTSPAGRQWDHRGGQYRIQVTPM